MEMVKLNDEDHKNLDGLLDKYPDATKFYLAPGEYELTDILDLDRPNMILSSQSNDPKSVHIYQTNNEKDGVHIKADNVLIQGITFHNENGLGTCLICRDRNSIIVTNCVFYGSGHSFTVYYGSSTDESIEKHQKYGKDMLSSKNCFSNNIVYTKTEDDETRREESFGFFLQNHGQVRDNKFRGGRSTFCLSKNCVVSNNKIYDSSKNGIKLILPCQNVEVSNNTIDHTKYSSINILAEPELRDHFRETSDIKILNNTIVNSEYIGVELNYAHNVTISGNKIKRISGNGIYVLESEGVIIENNVLSQNSMGVLFDNNANGNRIEGNVFYSVYPHLSEHSICLINSTSNNLVTDNTIKGIHSSISLFMEGENNESTGNNIHKFLTFSDEMIHL